MSLRELPAAAALTAPQAYRPEAPSDALGRWAPLAAEADDPATISLFDRIGMDVWTGEGWTAKRMAGALRSIGSKPVTVAINSPGGDVFEGLAIYNLLREHPAEVSVKVMGLAASAASVIAMAGDTITMGLGSQMMVHRSWGMVVGNSADFAAAVPIFEGFDASMTEIYAARTGLSKPEIAAYLDGPDKASDGTWFTAEQAVDAGFADQVSSADRAAAAAPLLPAALAAKRRLDVALATGKRLTSSERRALFKDLGTPGAADTAMPGAGVTPALIDEIKGLFTL